MLQLLNINKLKTMKWFMKILHKVVDIYNFNFKMFVFLPNKTVRTGELHRVASLNTILGPLKEKFSR